jgi:hypothetical protein
MEDVSNVLRSHLSVSGSVYGFSHVLRDFSNQGTVSSALIMCLYYAVPIGCIVPGPPPLSLFVWIFYYVNGIGLPAS